MSRRVAALLPVLCMAICAQADAAPAAETPGGASPSTPAAVRIVQPQWPRDYGYMLGDRVDIGFVIDVDSGWALDRDGLPRGGLVVGGFELREAQLQPAATSACPRCQRLLLHWQLFRSVREPTVLKLTLPRVRFRKGAQVEALKLPAFTLSAAPLQDWLAQRDWATTVQPSLPPQPYAPKAAVHRAALALAAAAGCLLAWAFSTGRFAAPRRRPFAAAHRALRRLSPGAAPQDMLKLVHRAFDDSAGHAVFASQLSAYFAAHPEFADLAAPVQQLFAASQRVFFDTRAQAPARAEVLKLLRALRDRERLA